MKPLPTAPLTDEDLAIWLNYRGEARRAYGMGWYLSHSREADRRDAELMREAQSFSDFAKRCHGRTVFTVLNPPDMDRMPPIGGVQVGGRQRDITECA